MTIVQCVHCYCLFVDDLLENVNQSIKEIVQSSYLMRDIKKIKEGMFCIALYDDDKEFYRSVVVGVDDKEGKVRVRLTL